MNKLYCVLLAFTFWLCFSTFLSAQSLRYGIKAGAGVAALDYSPTPPPNNSKFDYYAGMWYARNSKSSPTFVIGGVLEYDFAKDFLCSAGAQFSTKFAHVVANDIAFSTNDFRLRVHYLQIPVNVHYRAGKLFLGAGCYAGFGIVGNWKNTHTIDDDNPTVVIKTSDKVKFADNIQNANLRRFDAGLRVEVGYGLKTVRLSLSYDHGLRNNLASGIDRNNQVYNSKLRHRAIYATATYYWLSK